MATKDKGIAVSAPFQHPTAGPSGTDLSIMAVRWRTGAAAADKNKLLDELGLSLYRLGNEAPLVAVNQTEGLSWVSAGGNAQVGPQAIERLEKSDLVEWVMPALRPQGTPKQASQAEP